MCNGVTDCNSKFLKVIAHSDYDFKQLEPERSPNQLLTIYPIVWFGSIVTTNPRMLGALRNKV